MEELNINFHVGLGIGLCLNLEETTGIGALHSGHPIMVLVVGVTLDVDLVVGLVQFGDETYDIKIQ